MATHMHALPAAQLVVALAEGVPNAQGWTWTDTDYARRDEAMAALGLRRFGRSTKA